VAVSGLLRTGIYEDALLSTEARGRESDPGSTNWKEWMRRFGGTGAQYVEGTKKSTVPFCNSALGLEPEGPERYSDGAKKVRCVSNR
jgi:hypothetical protein